jgi:hypothetical protein
MLQVLHYVNRSVDPLSGGNDTMLTYNGNDYYIPPFDCVVLMPCNTDDPEHQAPSYNSCRLLISTDVPSAENVPLLIMYLIDNTSNVGLWLRHGDWLGAYYTGHHAHIHAERCYLLMDKNQFFDLMRGQITDCWMARHAE